MVRVGGLCVRGGRWHFIPPEYASGGKMDGDYHNGRSTKVVFVRALKHAPAVALVLKGRTPALNRSFVFSAASGLASMILNRIGRPAIRFKPRRAPRISVCSFRIFALPLALQQWLCGLPPDSEVTRHCGAAFVCAPPESPHICCSTTGLE